MSFSAPQKSTVDSILSPLAVGNEGVEKGIGFVWKLLEPAGRLMGPPQLSTFRHYLVTQSHFLRSDFVFHSWVAELKKIFTKT